MLNAIKFLLITQLRSNRRSTTRKINGFTLIELLVALLISSIVLATLLGFMVNILTTDRREQAKSASEQEIQTALDYISRELQQAIYIYDANGLSRNATTDPTTSGIKNQIPPVVSAPGCTNTNTCVPVLVFWKRTPLSRDQNVTLRNGTSIRVGTLARLADGVTNNEQDYFVYSLVSYYLIRDNDTTWSNTARIGRFEVRGGLRDGNRETRSEPDGSGGTRNVSYLLAPDPGYMPFNLSLPGDISAKMNRWTKHPSETYTGNVQVLVDYIDQNTNAPAITCPTGMISTQNYADGAFPAALKTYSFYACVPDRAVNSDLNLAQIYMRGNALARTVSRNRVNTNAVYRVNSPFFPQSSIQVQGRSLISGQ